MSIGFAKWNYDPQDHTGTGNNLVYVNLDDGQVYIGGLVNHREVCEWEGTGPIVNCNTELVLRMNNNNVIAWTLGSRNDFRTIHQLVMPEPFYIYIELLNQNSEITELTVTSWRPLQDAG